MSAHGTPAVQTAGLTKSFGDARAVDGLDLTVQPGEVYGLLGPNGAGKTTTIRILATLLRPDAGTAQVFGSDVTTAADDIRSRISLTGQATSVDPDLTGAENLTLVARLNGYPPRGARQRAEELLAAFDLSAAAGRPARHYSGGMRRRLDLAAGLVSTPDLIFLDEPTTGLDPRSRTEVWALVRAIVAEGSTVLLTTQHLDEADQLADRVAVVDHGRVVAEGTPTELKATTGSGALRVRPLDPGQLPIAVEVLTRVLDAAPTVTGAECHVAVHDPDRATRALPALTGAGVTLATFSLSQPSLDEVFLSLTGHATSEEPQ